MKNTSVDLVISHDTTGSMYPCLTQVRNRVTELVTRLFDNIPDLRIGIIAHGDYCDAGRTYVTKALQFSTNLDRIKDFVNMTGPTHGGDSPECYELVLNEARSFAWRADAKKVFMMIGDDLPHEPSYPQNVKRINWREELKLLKQMGIPVYAVHAMADCRRHSKSFYEAAAELTDGYYLTLDQFQNVPDLIMAVCYKQMGNDVLEQFETALKKENRFTRNHEDIIYTLLKKKKPTTRKKAAKVSMAGRFQVMDVPVDSEIRSFVQSQGVEFEKGRGFYQLTKAETVQCYKEVVLVEKDTFDIYSGDDARDLVGLPPQTSKEAKTPDSKLQYHSNKGTDIFQKYFVFIQSTSVNRKLIGGTKFLYEVSDWKK